MIKSFIYDHLDPYFQYILHLLGDIVNYWVVETDYTNYSVVYDCKQLNPDGTCKTNLAWVYSRLPHLSNDLRAKVSHVIESLCLNEALFYTTKHRNGKNIFNLFFTSGCIVFTIKYHSSK